MCPGKVLYFTPVGKKPGFKVVVGRMGLKPRLWPDPRPHFALRVGRILEVVRAPW